MGTKKTRVTKKTSIDNGNGGGVYVSKSGRKYQMLRTPWWTPFTKDTNHPVEIEGVVTRLFETPAKKIGKRVLPPQKAIVLETEHGSFSVGCSASILDQVAELDEEREFVKWRIGEGQSIYIRYEGEGRSRPGQNAVRLYSVGVER